MYAVDLYSVFKNTGIDDRATGEKLRKLVLEPVAIDSGMRFRRSIYDPVYPGMDMLVRFLGRKPDPRAFLHHVGAQ